MIGSRVLEIYTVTRELGSGGMGAAYVAESEQKHRIVVKVLRPELAARPAMVKRFEEEARAASEIRHPNVVEIIGRGTRADGTHFIAMEFLDGKTLTAHMASWGAMACDAVLPIAVQICAGLKAAHQRSIVHRDIKPDNIFVCDYPTRGLVKILDFGIAKFLVDNIGLTHSNAVMGTPSYMAPEQASHTKTVGPTADVFAIAVVIFELLTGRRPYTAESLLGLLENYLQIGAGTLPHPRLIDVTAGRDIPAAWHVQIDRALNVSPNARPPTIRAFIEPMIDALPDGRAISDALAPSLLEAAGPEDATQRARGAPFAGGVATLAQVGSEPGRATVTGRNTAPPAAFAKPTTLHEAAGAHSGRAESPRRPRRYVLPVAIGAAVALGGATLVYAVSANGPTASQPSSPPVGLPPDATATAAASHDAGGTPADGGVAPPAADASDAMVPDATTPDAKPARRRPRQPAAGSRSGARIGDDDGDIFQ